MNVENMTKADLVVLAIELGACSPGLVWLDSTFEDDASLREIWDGVGWDEYDFLHWLCDEIKIGLQCKEAWIASADEYGAQRDAIDARWEKVNGRLEDWSDSFYDAHIDELTHCYANRIAAIQTADIQQFKARFTFHTFTTALQRFMDRWGTKVE